MTVDIVERLRDIDRAAWDACATGDGVDNPFVSYDFLSCLEDSGTVGPPQTGWIPRHIVLRDTAGAVLAVAPSYVKTHSRGEFVFDWNWAEAYQRAGGQYYPKLLVAVPFSPVTGPRLMVRGDITAPLRAQTKRQMAAAIASVVQRAGLSSAHVNFIDPMDAQALHEVGFTPRIGMQYHWKNNNYESFSDFLGELSSRKRKAIKRERRAVEQTDITIRHLSGADITPAHWDAMYGFYIDTGSRKWGQPYLNREFFDLLGERMADKVLLIMAERDGHPIAGALNLIGVNALYGRYWGCREDVPFLHFELCYHQAIEAAIVRGLDRVEAGAQGEHKIARGYLPVYTHSAHFITDPRLSEGIAGFCQAEKRAIEDEHALLMEESPYRQGVCEG